MDLNKTYVGNVELLLPTFPRASVHTIVTSPPYYALRDYKMAGQLGLEDTPEEYIDRLCSIIMLAGEVLRDDGTLWLNLGDSYWGGKGKSGQSYSAEYQNERYNAGRSFNGAHHQMGGQKQTRPTDQKHPVYKPKDLMGIPWRVALELQRRGWYLRQDIIWHKPNPMPESVFDRCTKSHEYIFLLSKSHQYYFDQESIMQDSRAPWQEKYNRQNGVYELKNDEKIVNGRSSGNKRRKSGSERDAFEGNPSNVMSHVPWEGDKANKKSVWSVATKGVKDAHFATFPQELIVDCIKAGCPIGGTVMDIFHGSGTTGIVSSKLERNFLAIELNPDYAAIEQKRRREELGIFA